MNVFESVEKGSRATGERGRGGVGPLPCQLSLCGNGTAEGMAPRLFLYTLSIAQTAGLAGNW